MSYTWKNEGRKSTIVPFYWTFLPFFGYTARMPLFSRISPEKLWSPNSPSLSFVLIRTTTEVRCNKPILELWPRRLGTHFHHICYSYFCCASILRLSQINLPRPTSDFGPKLDILFLKQFIVTWLLQQLQQNYIGPIYVT